MPHVYSGPSLPCRELPECSGDMTRGERVIAFIERYLMVPEGSLVGRPLKLEPFQRQFIRAIYDNPAGTQRAILSIARKNGKSALTAALLIAHIVGPEARLNSQIIGGAMSREQAALIFSLAAKMLRMSPELHPLVRIVDSRRTIHGLVQGVEYRAIAADGRTAHGLSPVLAILDETGQVRGATSEFVDAITTAQGAYEDALLVIISTQAADDGDLLSRLIDDAKQSEDPHTVCHVYAAEPECDLMDEAQWKRANPGLGVFRSIRDLRAQAEQAVRMPSSANSFRNLLLNQRVERHTPFISREVWASCSGEPRAFDGPVYGGLDLSKRADLTSFQLVGLADDGVWDVLPMFWLPEEGLVERSRADRQPYDAWVEAGFLRTTPGASVDYAYVARDIAEATRGLEVVGVAYDRWRIELMRPHLEEWGSDLPLVDYGQGFRDMSPAVDELESALLNGKIRHGSHPVLTMCAANAVVVSDPSGNRKLDKSRAKGRIDGIVALAMALGLATRPDPEPERRPMVFAG